jgi:hypothetical protein
MKLTRIVLAALGAATLFVTAPAKAQIIITEVDPSGSATSNNGYNNGYNQDWFELTNYGTSAVNISGWKMDDNHDSTSAAVALTGVASIAAGQSVVFVEDTGTTAAAVDAAFEQSWFGSNVPTGFTIGNYGGSSVGLSQSGDAVNIYNSSNVLQAGVQFGVSAAGVCLDNSVAQLSGTTGTGSSDPTISTNSAAGVNGAFVTTGGHEIGSPGAVPEPKSWLLGATSVAIFLVIHRLRRRA